MKIYFFDISARAATASTDIYDPGRLVAGLVALLFILFLYFLPTLIAFSRQHRSKLAVLATNLLFGWTVIGWCIALIWSLTGDVERGTRAL
jgi:hypothetical protein